MHVQIERRSVYGQPRLYVTNEPAKTLLARLTGRRTLSDEDAKALEELGLTVLVRGVV